MTLITVHAAAARVSLLDASTRASLLAVAARHGLGFSRHAPRTRRSSMRRLQSALAWCCLDFLAREYFSEPQFFAGISFSSQGKPLHRSWHCSLTHSTDTVVAVLSSMPVGIDVEDPSSSQQLPARRAFWLSADKPHAAMTALDIWTSKEAVIKAAGGSLDDMRTVCLDGSCALFRAQQWHITPVALPWSCSSYLASPQRPQLELSLPEPRSLLS